MSTYIYLACREQRAKVPAALTEAVRREGLL